MCLLQKTNVQLVAPSMVHLGKATSHYAELGRGCRTEIKYSTVVELFEEVKVGKRDGICRINATYIVKILLTV